MTATRTDVARAFGCRIRGQAMVEYLVASAVLLALIAMPAPGGESALELLLQAVRMAHHRFGSAMSLPL